MTDEHQDSRWVGLARGFVEHAEDDPNLTVHRAVVRCLLDRGHIGSEHCIRIDQLQQLIPHDDREVLQQTVLDDLKRRGIVATLARRGGGVFIPNSMADVEEAVTGVINRVISELTNIQGILGP